MASTPAPKRKRDTSGIALFMVIAAMSVLSIMVTEFTYIAQINQKIAFDALDQVKVHYLAKSAFKLSLLRLKAYQIVKEVAGGDGKGGGPAAMMGIPKVPKGVLDKIWSFPFYFPIPTAPGMSMTEKDSIEAFQKATGFDGKFQAFITSESAKYNLNLLLAPFAAPQPSPSPTGAPTGSPAGPPQPGASPSPAPSFNPEDARHSLTEYMSQLLLQKIESDPEFASEYRDFRIEELMDSIFAWADRTYQRKGQGGGDQVAIKGAPFYSLSELHMVPGMTDELYNLFESSLTASTTPGINVNTMTEPTLRALVPGMNKEEVTDFFKYRDDPEADNAFKDEGEFFKYLPAHVGALSGAGAIDQFKQDLVRRGIRIVTDETLFKVTVQATINQSVRLIEAWVTLSASKKDQGGPAPAPGGEPQKSKGDSGLKVTFMRIL